MRSLGTLKIAKYFTGCMLAVLSATAHSQQVPGCGNLSNAYGPFDYSNMADREQKLPIVENYHFTPKVESLTEGQSGDLAMDIDYTLRTFPNHTGALWAMARYQLSRPWTPANHFMTVDCYFDRALAWRPNDASVWMVYGMYLARKGEREESVKKYERALLLQPDSAEVNYNAGLAFFEIKDYARSRDLAVKAYAAGYPMTTKSLHG